jgi:hypothetical protein
MVMLGVQLSCALVDLVEQEVGGGLGQQGALAQMHVAGMVGLAFVQS